MNNLVQIENDHAFTTTLIIAEGVQIEHRAVIKLLDTHINRPMFSALEVRRLTAKYRGKPTRYFQLNEVQATFLITLMKNREIVVQFKEKMVTEFFRMRRELDRIVTQQTNEQWLEKREAGIETRNYETDVIKDFVEYATAQGSESARMYYTNISKMENKALFIVEQKYKNLRQVLGVTDLSTIQNADIIVARALKEGMSIGLPYKEIYKLAKERVELFAQLRGQSVVAQIAHQHKLEK